MEPGLLPGYFPGITNATVLEILRKVLLSFGIVPFLFFLISLVIRISITFLLLSASANEYLLHGGQVFIDEKAVISVEKKLAKTTGFAVGLTSAAASVLNLILSPVKRKIEKIPFYQRHRKGTRLFAAASLILLILTLFNSFYFLHDPITIGHRGSIYGAENTKEAVQGAIDSGAQYAEIDVLLSSDGVPMVCHDVNLKRLTGENVNIYEKTAEELSSMSVAQNGYEGFIPTLASLLADTKGKIGLLIEFKLHGHETKSIVEQVLTVVKEYDALDSCLFHSLDLNLVKQLKELEPSCIAGYCIFANTGSLTVSALRRLNVDFLSVEENALNRKFILKCQKAWLPVYAWTVNQTSDMKRYLDMGVCGFITDFPDLSSSVIKNRLGREPESPYSSPDNSFFGNFTIQYPQ